MTRADKFEEIFGYRPATDQVLCNEHDWCGESDACSYCMCNRNNIGREEDWWNAEYKESTVKNLCDTCRNSTNCVMQSGIVRTECEMYKHSKNNLGISIGEAIEMLKFYNHGFTGLAGSLQDSIDVAVDTMRKYQKIEEILKEPCIIPEGCYPKLKKIKEVIENELRVKKH